MSKDTAAMRRRDAVRAAQAMVPDLIAARRAVREARHVHSYSKFNHATVELEQLLLDFDKALLEAARL